MCSEKYLVSLVIPCYNEESVLPHLKESLTNMLEMLSARYRVEIVLVDDGSRDRTWELISKFAREDSRFRAIALSRNFGHQVALSCGYDWAKGDAVISLDADLQDPPEVIGEMLQKWEDGADIVYAVRNTREGESRFKLWTAALFYRIFKTLSGTNEPMDSGDFRLLSRRSLAALRELKEKHRYIRGMVGWIGFRTVEVRYNRQQRVAGVTKYNLTKMISFALDGLISFSSFPLRLAYLMAFIGAVPVFTYLVYCVIMHFLFNRPLVPGWSSLLLTISSFGFLTLFCIGIMGEYLSRMYSEIKNRPLYFVRELQEINEKEKISTGES